MKMALHSVYAVGVSIRSSEIGNSIQKEIRVEIWNTLQILG